MPNLRTLSQVVVATMLATWLSLAIGAYADEPKSPYDVPQSNPQNQGGAHAFTTWPSGTVFFENGTNTGPPPGIKALVPSINATVPVYVYTLVVRPPGGGGLKLLVFATSDGVQATIDLNSAYGVEDCFGASPYISDFSGTIKAFVNCKRNDTGNGNDRAVVPVDSGIAASTP